MMFSENYKVSEKYEVLSDSTQRISSCSSMPWLYTPLMDDRYAPNTISTVTKQNLNKVLGFDYMDQSRDTIKNEDKELIINHDGDNILDYRTKVDISYHVLRREKRLFVNATDTMFLQPSWEKIEKAVWQPEGFVGSTKLTGMYHDQYGIPTAIEVLDKKYDVSHLGSDLLTELNNYSSKNIQFCNGRLAIGPNSTHFMLDFQYPRTVSGMTTPEPKEFKYITGDELYVTKQKNISYYQGVSKHLFGMRNYGFLTVDQINAILNLQTQKTVYPTTRNDNRDTDNWWDLMCDFKINLEYIFTSDGTLDRIVLYRVLYDTFREIEIPRGFIKDGVDSRERPIEYAAMRDGVEQSYS